MADAVGARVQRKSLNLTDVTVCRGKRGKHCADINSGMGTNTVGQCSLQGEANLQRCWARPENIEG